VVLTLNPNLLWTPDLVFNGTRTNITWRLNGTEETFNQTAFPNTNLTTISNINCTATNCTGINCTVNCTYVNRTISNNTCASTITSNDIYADTDFWLMGLPFYRGFAIKHDLDKQTIGFSSSNESMVVPKT
jgi:hypothetical protein